MDTRARFKIIIIYRFQRPRSKAFVLRPPPPLHPLDDIILLFLYIDYEPILYSAVAVAVAVQNTPYAEQC